MLGANLAVAVAKLVAAAWTNSSAMLSEAIHTIVGVLSQALQHAGLRRSQRLGYITDEAPSFVQERERAFWGFVVGVLLFSMGAGVSIYDGVHKFLDPRPLTDAHIDYVVLAVAMVLTAYGTLQAAREASLRQPDAKLFEALRDARDPTLFTIVLKNIAAMAGLVAALAGIMASQLAGFMWADGLASIAVGLVMALVAVALAIELRSHITSGLHQHEDIAAQGAHAAGDLAPTAGGEKNPGAAATADADADADVAAAQPAGDLAPDATHTGVVRGKKAKKNRRRS